MSQQKRLVIHNVEDAMEIARMAGLFRPWLPESRGTAFVCWLFARKSAASPTSMECEIAGYFDDRNEALRRGEDLDHELQKDIEFALDWESIDRQRLLDMADYIERTREGPGGRAVMSMFATLATSAGRSMGKSNPSLEGLTRLQQLLKELGGLAKSLQIKLQLDAGDVYRCNDATDPRALARIEELLCSPVRRFQGFDRAIMLAIGLAQDPHVQVDIGASLRMRMQSRVRLAGQARQTSGA